MFVLLGVLKRKIGGLWVLGVGCGVWGGGVGVRMDAGRALQTPCFLRHPDEKGREGERERGRGGERERGREREREGEKERYAAA